MDQYPFFPSSVGVQHGSGQGDADTSQNEGQDRNLDMLSSDSGIRRYENLSAIGDQFAPPRSMLDTWLYESSASVQSSVDFTEPWNSVSATATYSPPSAEPFDSVDGYFDSMTDPSILPDFVSAAGHTGRRKQRGPAMGRSKGGGQHRPGDSSGSSGSSTDNPFGSGDGNGDDPRGPDGRLRCRGCGIWLGAGAWVRALEYHLSPSVHHAWKIRQGTGGLAPDVAKWFFRRRCDVRVLEEMSSLVTRTSPIVMDIDDWDRFLPTAHNC